MPNDNELLAAELELLADEAQLGRGVSAQRACQEGRRILRRRRAIGTTGGVGATGLALVLAVVLLPTHTRGGAADGNGPGTTSGPGDVTMPVGPASAPASAAGSASAGVTPQSTASGHDPLIGSATFGWLPSGFAVNGYNDNPAQAAGDIGPRADSYSAVYEVSAQTADGEGQVSLALFPTGTAPVDVGQAGSSAAPAVNSWPAYWQSSPDDQVPNAGEVVLDWQYQPGTWAELSLLLGTEPQAAAQNTALQIARNTRFGQTKEIALPFKRVVPPPGLSTVTASWEQVTATDATGSTWEETLSFANQPDPAGGDPTGYDALQIGVAAAGLNVADSGFTDIESGAQQTSGTTIDGHPAMLTTGPGYTLLTVQDIGGFGTVEVQGTGAQGTALAVPGAAAALINRLDLLGPAPSGWTTDVVG